MVIINNINIYENSTSKWGADNKIYKKIFESIFNELTKKNDPKLKKKQKVFLSDNKCVLKLPFVCL